MCNKIIMKYNNISFKTINKYSVLKDTPGQLNALSFRINYKRNHFFSNSFDYPGVYISPG